MSRRTRQRGGFVPVTAEVLEVRALLSAGAGAVQSAVNHAAAASYEGHAVGSLAKGQNFQGPVTAQFTADGNAQQLPAVISISPVIETVGSHVTAQVTLVASGLGGLNIALTAKITGKVESWQTQANETVFTLAPGGSIVEKLTDSFGHHFTERAKPVGTPLTITVDLSGQFTLLEGTFISLKSRLGPGAPFDFLAYTA